MSFVKLIASLLFSLLLNYSYAQSHASYFIGEATHLKGRQNAAPHVLCMKNGNTILFYLEKERRIVIKIFDSSRKQIANKKFDSRIIFSFIAPNMLKGAYDINDEAVLFLLTEGRYTALKVRFNSHTGVTIEEKIINKNEIPDYGQSKSVTAYFNDQADSTKHFFGQPARMFTEQNGHTMIFSVANKTMVGDNPTPARDTSYPYGVIQYTSDEYEVERYTGSIGVTLVDRNGRELWGTALPLAQYFSNMRSRPTYSNNMTSVNVISKDNNYFIVYNDYNTNFSKTGLQYKDTVFNFDKTNACYYKIDSNKNITRHHLFGMPKPREYITAFISGASFDYDRNTYASLVQYKKGRHRSLRMAWSHLE